MSRTELVVAMAVALLAAFCLGWLASWLLGRVGRAGGADPTAMDRLVQSLHEAEEAREEARARAETCEAEHAVALSALEEARSEADALRAWIERARSEGS